MSDDPLRLMLSSAVEKLRGASDLTMNEIVGLRALPDSARTPEIAYALGTIEGAAMALRCTPHELLEDHDLLVAAKRES
jgi:hypothetical protein